jgi:hypothetical protein
MKSPIGNLDRVFARARRAAAATKLPEIEPGTSYGTPSLKVRGKSMMRVKDADTLVFMCPLEEKEMLLEAAAEIYFETDHYKGWPAVLVRVAAADDAELRHCILRAWRMQAPKRLLAAWEAGAPVSAAARPKQKSKPGKKVRSRPRKR